MQNKIFHAKIQILDYHITCYSFYRLCWNVSLARES